MGRGLPLVHCSLYSTWLVPALADANALKFMQHGSRLSTNWNNDAEIRDDSLTLMLLLKSC